MNQVQIAIVDDNVSLAESLSQKLAHYKEIEILFKAQNGLEAFEILNKTEGINHPDVILMDIEMPIMNGIEATAAIKRRWPQIKILTLTVFDDDDKIFDSILAGASGYFLKDESTSRIVEGIDELMSGGAPMSRSIAGKTLELFRAKNTPSKPAEPSKSENNFDLTKREIEILEWISKGYTRKMIADACFISPSTVKKHIENIYGKLQISSRAEMMKLALKNKWVSGE